MERLDPVQVATDVDRLLVWQLYDGLAEVTPEGRVAPALAQSWETSGDGLVWRFYLRPGARWSDGEALRADEVVAHLHRLLASVHGAAMEPVRGARAWRHRRLARVKHSSPPFGAGDVVEPVAGPIEGERVTVRSAVDGAIVAEVAVADLDLGPGVVGVRADGPSTVIIELDRPEPLLPYRTALAPWRIARADGTGSGAYRLLEQQPDRVVLARNELFHPPARSERVEVTILALVSDDASGGCGAIGPLDRTTTSTPDPDWRPRRSRVGPRVDFARLPGYAVGSPRLATFSIYLNTERLVDVSLRHALAAATPRREIASELGRSYHQTRHLIPTSIPHRSTSSLPVAALDYQPPDGIAHDVEQAKARLDSAAELPDRELVVIYQAGEPGDEIAARRTAEAWTDLGVASRAVSVPVADFGPALAAGDFDAALYTWTAEIPDPLAFLDPFDCDSPNNTVRLCDDVLDRWLAAATAEPDLGRRLALAADIERRILSQAIAIPLLVHSYVVVRSGLRGLTSLNLLGQVYFRGLEAIGAPPSD